LPLKGYRIHVDQSIYTDSNNEKEEIKQKFLYNLIKLTGANVVDSIRQSDFCIIESFDSKTFKVPVFVMLLKINYLFDALLTYKQPDYDQIQYKPQDMKKRKLRK